MLNVNPSGNGTANNSNGNQSARPATPPERPVELPDEASRVVRGTRPQGSPSETGKGKPRVDWQMVVLWIFVALSFAALAYAGCVVWSMCPDSSTF